MLNELKEYREFLKAIKVSEANMDLESDLKILDIDKKELKKKLINDSDIINKVREKVNKKWLKMNVGINIFMKMKMY